jgi:hypothetical protein
MEQRNTEQGTDGESGERKRDGPMNAFQYGAAREKIHCRPEESGGAFGPAASHLCPQSQLFCFFCPDSSWLLPSGFPSISALVVRMGMRVQRARARGRFAGMAE